jgi:hypothetical protein
MMTTLQAIKDYLGITDATYDSLLTTWQAAIEGVVVDVCGTDFARHTASEIIDGTRSDVIVVKNYPIISVEAVIFHCMPDGTQGTTIDVNSYKAQPEAIYLYQGLYTPFNRSCVRVDYTYGYAAVPAQVVLAIYMGIEAFKMRKDRKVLGMASRSKEGESENYINAWDTKTGLPKEVIAMLQQHKQFEFPVQPMATRNI